MASVAMADYTGSVRSSERVSTGGEYKCNDPLRLVKCQVIFNSALAS